MARPRKLTMDFFIHDANASSDRKIKLLSKKHGNDGYATYFRLLESLCNESGMKLDLSNTEVAELLSGDYHLRDVQHLYKVIQYCADIQLFDRQLWESERIVFSHGLYSRYADRLEDRKAAAERQKRSRDAKAIQGKIDRLNQVVTSDNAVTTGLSQDCHSPEIRVTEDQSSELQNPELQSSKSDSLRSIPEGEARQGEKEVQPLQPQSPQHDLFSRRGAPQVVAVQAQFSGPWGVGYTDELKEFEAWLLAEKSTGKTDKSAWIAAVVNGIAKGGSRALWEEFQRSKARAASPPPPTRRLQAIDTVEDPAEYQRRVWLQQGA